MKQTGLILLMVAGLTSCQTAVVVRRHVSGGQAVVVDTGKALLIRVEGVETRPTPVEYMGVPNPREGEPIHRVLENGDGKVLFAYDLQVGKALPAGSYRLQLKPSAKTPTFKSSREVTMMSGEDTVRVELMEQPGTAKKIVDVFTLTNTGGDGGAGTGFREHAMRAHLWLVHLFRGD